MLAVSLSGNALVSINVVTLRRARLVPGSVTIFGRVNSLGMYTRQLSLAILPCLGAMSTSLGWEGNRKSGVALAVRQRQ